MARLSPETYNPHLSFRFKIVFSTLQNVQFYGKSATLPSAENNPLTLEYGNTYMKVKSKTRWNDCVISCYAYENMTMNELWNYLDQLHQNVNLGQDKYADEYKKDVYIHLLRPNGESTVGAWKLTGAFISAINYGQVDYTTEEIVQPEITLAYDYARYIIQS